MTRHAHKKISLILISILLITILSVIANSIDVIPRIADRPGNEIAETNGEDTDTTSNELSVILNSQKKNFNDQDDNILHAVITGQSKDMEDFLEDSRSRDTNILSGEINGVKVIDEYRPLIAVCGNEIVEGDEECDDGDQDIIGVCGTGECRTIVPDTCVNSGLPNECTGVACIPGLPTDEICDELDNNCNGFIDEGFEVGEFCISAPNNCGDVNEGLVACTPEGGSECDVLPPPDRPTVFTFVDADGDGFGSTPVDATCFIPPGTVDNDLDCDDTEATINPLALGGAATEGEAELCDGIDNNCDNVLDDGCPICVEGKDDKAKKHFKTTKGTARTDDDFDSKNVLTVRGAGFDNYKGDSDDDMFVILSNGAKLNIKTDTIPPGVLITGIEIESTQLVPLQSNTAKKNSVKAKGVLKKKDGDNIIAFANRYFSIWSPFFSWVYTWDTATVDNSGDPDYAGFASLGITTDDELTAHIDLKPIKCKDVEDDDDDDDGKKTCRNCDQITSITYRYLGTSSDTTADATDKRDDILQSNIPLNGFGEFTVTNIGHPETTVTVGTDSSTYHASCSRPIFIGDVIGSFEIVDMTGTGIFVEALFNPPADCDKDSDDDGIPDRDDKCEGHGKKKDCSKDFDNDGSDDIDDDDDDNDGKKDHKDKHKRDKNKK